MKNLVYTLLIMVMSFLTPLSMEAGFLNGAYGKQMAEKLIQDLEYQLSKLEKGPSNSQTEAKKREIRNKIAVAKSDYNEQYGKASYSSESEKDAMESTLRIAPNKENKEKESRLKVAQSPREESSNIDKKKESFKRAQIQLKKRLAQLGNAVKGTTISVSYSLDCINVYLTNNQLMLEVMPYGADRFDVPFQKSNASCGEGTTDDGEDYYVILNRDTPQLWYVYYYDDRKFVILNNLEPILESDVDYEFDNIILDAIEKDILKHK